MVFTFLIIIGFAIFILAFLPQIIKQIKLAFPDKETTAKLEPEEEARKEKGALGNTIDFIFGEGTVNTEQERFNEFVTGKNKQQRQTELVEEKASIALGSKVTFPTKSTVIVTPDGKIFSDKSPTFKLSQEEIKTIQDKFRKENSAILLQKTSIQSGRRF